MAWNEKCTKCDKPWTYGVEYEWSEPCSYDGISEWSCIPCNVRVGRWTGKELSTGEHEPPHGGRHRQMCKDFKPIPNGI